MDRPKIIQSTATFVACEFASEASGHDWFHVNRVRRLALRLATAEGCDLFIAAEKQDEHRCR
jgi:uncharacterized protein